MAVLQGGPGRGARLRELAGLFIRLGTTAFGGPAAHAAKADEKVAPGEDLMREHGVLRRVILKAVEEVAKLEAAFGINDLARFTP